MRGVEVLDRETDAGVAAFGCRVLREGETRAGRVELRVTEPGIGELEGKTNAVSKESDRPV